MNSHVLPRHIQRLLARQGNKNISYRTLVSAQFDNRDAWDSRLASPVFSQIKMADYFVSLDKKFSQELRGSAVDVDIFANNVKNETQAEHMEELLYKLRRTPDTLHTLASTHHAAVRSMLDHGTTENLVKMLDDRMNYGIFFDDYSAVLTLDKLLEAGDFHGAARCASQLMLQEEQFEIACALGNLAAWKYFASGREVEWYYPGELEVDENPDEVIRVRVKVLPNNYTDNHFDLRDPDKILGKTLIHFNKNSSDVVGRSLTILGESLYGSTDSVVAKLKSGKDLAASVLTTLQESADENIATAAKSAKSVEIDIESKLREKVAHEVKANEESMIKKQKEIYDNWKLVRDQQLQKYYEELQRNARIEAIEQTKKDLEQTEESLFFFDNFNKFETEKEVKKREWRKSLPRTNWNMKNFPMNKYYKKTNAPDGERKIARWEKREQKMGPPK